MLCCLQIVGGGLRVFKQIDDLGESASEVGVPLGMYNYRCGRFVPGLIIGAPFRNYNVFDIQEFLECRMLELILEMKLSLWNTCTYVFVHYKEHMPEKKALNFTFSNLLSICTFGTYFILMVFLLPIQQIFTRQVPLV